MNALNLTLALALSAAAAAPPGATGPGTHQTPAGVVTGARAAPIRVVASLPVYAEIAKAVGGDAVEVTSIADPAEDAHFVRPKPSYALRIRQADVFITTGLDLELWVPALLDKAGNAKVSEGGTGYVTTYPGIELMDVPTAADRSEGDIHVYGNPHVFTDPLNVVQVARNIAAGLKRAAPGESARFDRNLAAFSDQVYRRLFGAELVTLLGGETLERLARQGGLLAFLRGREYEGAPLIDRLGGWLEAGMAFRGQKIICYHKNWAYFENRFGVSCVDYVEAKPGIPPTPGHVAGLMDLMRNQGIDVLLAANYFDPSKVQAVARRAGAVAVRVPLQPGGREAPTYFDLVNLWVRSLAAAFEGG